MKSTLIHLVLTVAAMLGFSAPQQAAIPQEEIQPKTAVSTATPLVAAAAVAPTAQQEAVPVKTVTQPAKAAIATTPANFVTQETLNAKLLEQQQWNNRIQELLNNNISQRDTLPATGGMINNFGLMQHIDKLERVSISNVTLSNVSGLTDDDIPDDITINTSSLTVNATSTLAGIQLTGMDCSVYGNSGKLTTDSFGNVICADDYGAVGGVGAPGATSGTVQYNDSGNFGGSAGFTYNKTANILTVPQLLLTGSTTLKDVTASSATTTNATSTNFFASNAKLDSVTLGTLSGILYSSNGLVSAVATSSIGLLASTSIQASAPLSWNVSTGALTISQATVSSDGYLSSSDWANFNSRLSSSSIGLLDKGYFFSTTSTDYWKSVNDFFSTTSVDYWKSVNDFFSTTSASYFLSQNQGAAFSTTSAIYFAHSSTTIAKTYTANAFGALQTFNAGLSALAGTISFASTTAITVSGTASTSALVVSSLNSASCDVKATVAGILFCGTDATGGGGGGGSDFIWTSNFGNLVAATTSPLWAQSGLFASSTSHFANADFINATTSTFAITGVGGSLLKTLSSGAIVAAQAGVDYITTDTAGNWFTPASNFGALANSTSTPVWFQAGLQASSTSQLAGAIFAGKVGIGTSSPSALFSVHATGSSAFPNVFAIGSSTASGALSTLFAISNTGTTTILNGVEVVGGCFKQNGTCINAGSDFIINNATTTNLTVTNVTNCNVSNGKKLGTGNSGNVLCESDSISFTQTTNYGALTYATSTPIWFQAGLQASSTSRFVFASTTSITVSGTASTTNLIVSSLNSASCDVKATVAGILFCGTDATGGGGGGSDFIWTSNFGNLVAATSSATWFQSGIQASSTSQFVSANFSGSVSLGTTSPAHLSIQATASPTGPEIFANGSFATDASSWTLGNCAAYSSGHVTATKNACTDMSVSQNVSLTLGQLYEIQFDLSGVSGDEVIVWGSNGITPIGGTDAFSQNGHVTYIFYAELDGTQTIYIDAHNYTNGGTYTVDNVSLMAASYAPAINAYALDGSPILHVDDAGLAAGQQVLSLGYKALVSSANNFNNVAIGNYALSNADTGSRNVAVGTFALKANTSGSNNAAVGDYALALDTTGQQNAALGSGALAVNTDGSLNAAVGYKSLNANTIGYYNSAVGAFALNFNTTGQANAAFGYNAMANNTTGSYNTAIGNAALSANLTGIDNVAIGDSAMGGGQIAYQNTAIGAGALYSVSGSNNVAVGLGAGRSVTTGSANILLGSHISFSNVITSGNGNVGLGNELWFASQTGNNQLNIGSIIFGTLPATTTQYSQPTTGSVGIATTSSSTLFAIHANAGSTKTSLFAIGSSTANATSTLFSVSNTGSTTLFQLPSSLLKTDANGAIVAASAGSDYLVLVNASLVQFTAGIISSASTTVGNGSQTGGLTVAGGATTTGNSYIGGALNVVSSGRFGSTLSLSAVATCTGGQALQTNGSGDISCGNVVSGSVTSAGGWATNNVGSVTLATTTDRVGIGATTTPYAKLTVISGSTATTTAAFLAQANQTANIFDIYTANGTLNSVFTANGYFGIGTTSPYAPLSVVGQAVAAYFTASTSIASTFPNASSTLLTVSGTSYFPNGGVWNSAGVGVGSSSPWGLFSVEMDATRPSFVVSNNGSSTPAFFIGGVNQNGVVGVGTSTNATSTAFLVQGLNAANATVAAFTNGTGTCYIRPTSTAFTCSSDIRLKHNINDLTPALSTVMALNPVTYNWNSEEDGAPTHAGFIAQEVEPLMPDLVFTDEYGMKTLNYAGLTPYLTSAIQELDLNLSAIASTSASSTPASRAFAGSFFASLFSRVGEWLASATNGITEVIAGTFKAKEKICVDDQCLTKDDIRSLLEMAHSQTASAQESPAATAQEEPQPAADDSSASSTPAVPDEPAPEPDPDASSTPSV